MPLSLIFDLRLTAIAAQGVATHILRDADLWAAALIAAIFVTLFAMSGLIRFSTRLGRFLTRWYLVNRRQLPRGLPQFLRFGADIGIFQARGREYCFADDAVAAHLSSLPPTVPLRPRKPFREVLIAFAVVDLLLLALLLAFVIGNGSNASVSANTRESSAAPPPTMRTVVPVALPPLAASARPDVTGVDPVNAVGFIRRLQETPGGADIAFEMVTWRQCPGECIDDNQEGEQGAPLHYFALTPTTRCTLQQWRSATGQIGTEPGDITSLAAQLANYPDSYYALDVARDGTVVALSEVYKP